MQSLGSINKKEIFYINVRKTPNWFTQLPTDSWLAFTIVDNEDKELIDNMVLQCLDKYVSYTCSAGQLASFTENIFDIEIVNQAILVQDITGKVYDYTNSPITTAHSNFGEGFWFATTLAPIADAKEINKIICIDCTQKSVKNHLITLISKINDGWLPSNKEVEQPVYDI